VQHSPSKVSFSPHYAARIAHQCVPLFVFVTVMGCAKPASTNVSKEAKPPSISGPVSENKSLLLAHDVGRVLTGTVVEHRFQVTNPFPFPVSVLSDSDITKSCGCTTLDLSRRELPPGASSDVLMRVNTQGKSGKFSVSGLVQWTWDSEHSWPVHLILKGNADPVLAAEPINLRFSSQEISGHIEKEVVLFAGSPVSWSTLKAAADPPYAEVISSKIDHGRVKLKLRATPPKNLREFSATLFLSAALEKSPDSQVPNCRLAIPINGVQELGIRIAPSTVFAQIERRSSQALARFIVVGSDLPQGPNPIASVSCEELPVSWKVHAMAPSAGSSGGRPCQIDLFVSSLDETRAHPERRKISVRLTDHRSVDVPVVFIRPAN
jgi:hypothetical protein